MTTALGGGEWSAARPGCTLPPGKTQYPLYRRPGGHQGRSGQAENLVHTRIRSQTVQPKSLTTLTELPGPVCLGVVWNLKHGIMKALFLLFYAAYVPQNSYKDDSTCIYTSQQSSLVDRIIALDQRTNMVK